MRKRIVVVRHGDDPPDDRVYVHLTGRGYDVEVFRPFAGENLGEPDGTVAGTVLHGGPHNVDDFDAHPFLREEYRWIDACLKAGTPTLGICQGAQQIAHHLGSSVGPKEGAPYEFGYYRVDPVPGGEDFLDRPRWFTQAHYHTFDMPAGARRLATGETFENQAFAYGDKVYGLQFHPEVTMEGFRRWQKADFGMYGKPGAQTEAEQNGLMLRHDGEQADWFHVFLDKLFGAPGGA